MPLYTFLEEYDLSGKTVIPFNSHGGSQFSRTIETIQELQPEAEVIANGYTVSRNSMDSASSGGGGMADRTWILRIKRTGPVDFAGPVLCKMQKVYCLFIFSLGPCYRSKG